MPLVDTTTDNGCLVIVPGSHHRGLIEHEVSASNPAFREVADGGALALELPAGHAVAFSGLLLHGSLDNRSSTDRVALFARYCHPAAHMVTERGKSVLDDGHSWMVRGQASLASWRSANDKFTA